MPDLSNIPNSPGVYLFKGANDKVIYIGKAINLRARVRSYWQETSWRERPKLAVLVPQISDFETIITSNEKEALILEASLIYKYQPKYNVLLKDNPNFPWIAITYGEPFPRLLPVRDLKWIKRKFPQAKLFGPYTDVGGMYQTLKTSRELFPLRKRATPLFKDRACLNYHLGHCLGPCQALVSEEEYEVMLQQLELFLTGKHDALIEQVKQKMQHASEYQNYETAARYRDQIKILQKTLENQQIIIDDTECERDLIGFAFNEQDLCLQIFKMRGGKLIGREAYAVVLNELQTLGETIESILEQAYLLRQVEDIPAEVFIQDALLPDEINLSDSKLDNKTLLHRLEELLENIAGKVIAVSFPESGQPKEQLELASYNAEQQLQSQQKQKAKLLLSIEALQEALELDFPPLTIDCFDISHLQGTHVVASCVRLKEGQPDKSKYRKFKLTIDQNNDFYSMREVVYRRYHQSHANKEIDLPDLILIDGGKGQLGAALEAVEQLQLIGKVKLFSLAKREEEVFSADGKKIIMPRNSPALQVLQRARDEAHRFAVTFNRERREKSSKRSFVDDIGGIGQVIKDRIMKNFTLKELLEAPPQALNAKLGIGAKRADRLWQEIKRTKEEESSQNAQ